MTRFPIAVICMTIFTLIWVFTDSLNSNESLGRMLVGLIIAAYLAVIITLAREGKRLSRLLPVQITLAVILAILFWFSKELRLNLPMAVGGVLLLLGNAVIWKKSRDDLHVWDFTHKIWTGAGFAVLGSIIFTAGTFAIQEALKSLFSVNIKDLTEHLILPIGLGLLAPLYWLSTVPPVDEPYDELIDNPGFVSKAVAFLGTWLLSPLTLIYAAILLAYAVKILMAGALPKGEIAQLTTPFLLIGTLTWLVLEPPFIKDKTLAKLFRKLWFPISIPAAIMLAIAVFVRVGEYGFTPERVMLMLIVIWSLGLALRFSTGQTNKRDIRIIPGFAAALLFIGTLGSGWLSIASQYSRLDKSLSKAVSKTDGRFVVIDKDAAQTIKGAINYLNRQDAQGVMRRAFSKIDYAPKDDFKLVDIYEDLNLEGIKVPSGYNLSRSNRVYEVGQTYNRGKAAISISGYDELVGPYFFYSDETYPQKRHITTIEDIEVEFDNNQIIFLHKDIIAHSFNISEWAKTIPIDKEDEARLTIEIPIHLIFEDQSVHIAMLVENLSLWETDSSTTSMSLKFYLLSKNIAPKL